MNNNITEKVERYNEIGQVVRVSLKWRGKTYMLQMFFPGSKFPSRQEVEAQVKKIYPDSVVMVHYASETQPNQPLIRVTEGAGKEIINTVLPNTKRRKTDPNMTPDMLKRYRENMTASHELQGDQIDEFLAGVPGDGYIGHRNLDIKNPFAKKQIKKPTPNVKNIGINVNKLGNNLGNIRNIKNKAFNQNNSYEPDGEMVQETPYGRDPNFIKRRNQQTKTNLNTERTPALNDDSFSQKYKDDAKKAIKASKEKIQTNSYQPEGEVVNEEESQNPTFTQFMKRIDQLPEVTREAIKNCGNDPMIAKAALEISGIDK